MPKVVRIPEKNANKHSEIGRSHKKAGKKLEIAKNREKSFKYYQSLPAELKMMVVDEMEPVDRCRFSQCSLLSSMEAKRSKNYLYSLEFYGSHKFGEEAKLTVKHDDNSNSGYLLHIEVESDKKLMKYKSLQHEELWRIELPDSTDLIHYAAEHFKNMLNDYQNIIKKLKLMNYAKKKLNIFDFGFRNLTKLEVLEIDVNSSILPIISKLRKPLKTLAVYGKRTTLELKSYEISNISEVIDLPRFKLNYEQFVQLSAPRISINIGKLTEEDICKIIESWKSQPSKAKSIFYEFNMRGSSFDVSKLLTLLGSDRFYDENAKFEVLMKINHRFENGKSAFLVHNDELLQMKEFPN